MAALAHPICLLIWSGILATNKDIGLGAVISPELTGSRLN
jgi:hypothetical protein